MGWVVALGLLLLVIWIVLVFFWHGFWRMDIRLPPAGAAVAAGGRWPDVVAIVPARNEEAHLQSALASLLGQDYPGRFAIIAVNDSSTDRTGEIAREAAARSGGRLLALDALEKPAGWAGKLWALKTGLEALPLTGIERPAYVWFTDADIVHETDVLRRLVQVAEGQHRALVSAMVRLHCRYFWERLLIPAFVYFFFLLYPPRAVARPDRYAAGAAGGCLLVKRAALEDIGGMESIRGEIIDDCALARRVKDRGHRLWLGLSDSSRSLRRYPDLSDIAAMIMRSAYAQLGHSPLMALLAVCGVILAFVLPAAYVPGFVFGDAAAHFPGLVAFGLMTASMLPVVRFYELPARWALALPVAAAFYAAFTALSAIRHHLGRPPRWRGRSLG
jgi:hopene-associated glycosyltransferase HpnB